MDLTKDQLDTLDRVLTYRAETLNLRARKLYHKKGHDHDSTLSAIRELHEVKDIQFAVRRDMRRGGFYDSR